MNICPICQNNLAYGDFYSAELPEGEIVPSNGYPNIRIMQMEDGKWHLAYSNGEPIDGIEEEYVSVGQPINYCPNCGRELDNRRRIRNGEV